MAETVNLQVYQGDDEAWTLPVANADGSAANLTGDTVTAQIRRRASDATAIDMAVDTGDFATGIVGLSLTAAVTADMSGNYVWDCQVDDGALVKTVARGTVTVTDEVTRP